MVTVNLAQAKANLEELLDQVEHGEEVVVTRQGRAIARIIPTLRQTSPLPFDDLARFRATMPRSRRSATTLLREARDKERY
jgi:prevent-host-death family protein